MYEVVIKQHKLTRMSDTFPDPYESYPIKDNLWFKNNNAHSIARKKNDKSNTYCTFCRHHHCGDPTRVYGNRSLKKSKVVSSAKTKYTEKPVMSPDFLNVINGENNFEDYNLE
jgi:hypothetical protein